MANKTILSTIFNNQQLLLKITSGLNLKVETKDTTIRKITDGLSSAVSAVVNDYNTVVPTLAESLYTFIYNQQIFNSDLSSVLTGFLPDTPVSTILDQKISAVDSAAAGYATIAEENATSYASGIVKTTSTFISGVLGKWTTASGTVASRIINIEQQIGGGGSQSLKDRIERLQTATTIQVTSGTPIINSTTQKLDTSYNPVAVASIDDDTGKSDMNKVKFIGDCKVSYGADGQIVIRIGQNLNSSNFNNNDGFADLGAATAQGSITGGSVTGTPASDYDGSSTTMLKTPSTTVSIINNKKCHFDNNKSTTFKVTAYVGKTPVATEMVIGPITGNGTFANTTYTGVTVSITNFGAETKAADGATGYCANVSVSVTTAVIDALAQNQDIYFKVEHINGSEDTKPYQTGKIFVIDNDNDTTVPEINDDITLTFTSSTTKQNSGVTYITKGTATVSTTNITNLNVPGYISNWSKVTFNKMITGQSSDNATGCSKTDNSTTGTGSFTKTFSTLNTGYHSSIKATAIAKNCNGASTSKDSNTLAGPYNIDVTSNKTNGNTAIYFTNETNRLKNSDLSTYDSTASIEDTTDLMVTCGKLQYPASSMFGYTYDQTAIRTYVYKFIKAGSLPGGTVTLKTSANPSTNISNGSMKLEVSKNGTTWYDISFISNVANIGKSNSTWGTTSNAVFGFGDGDANGGMWFRVSMKSTCTLTVSEITFA